jgi:hypothetical protein
MRYSTQAVLAMFGHPVADGVVCHARSAQATKRTRIWAGGLSTAEAMSRK